MCSSTSSQSQIWIRGESWRWSQQWWYEGVVQYLRARVYRVYSLHCSPLIRCTPWRRLVRISGERRIRAPVKVTDVTTRHHRRRFLFHRLRTAHARRAAQAFPLQFVTEHGYGVPEPAARPLARLLVMYAAGTPDLLYDLVVAVLVDVAQVPGERSLPAYWRLGAGLTMFWGFGLVPASVGFTGARLSWAGGLGGRGLGGRQQQRLHDPSPREGRLGESWAVSAQGSSLGRTWGRQQRVSQGSPM